MLLPILKTKNCCKTAKYVENEKGGALRITSKTVLDINKMQDNFELQYVLTYPGIISRVELVPSPQAYARNGAPRLLLGN
jgi:hypothetical protein